MQADVAKLVEQVRDAPTRTMATQSARILYEVRAGAPDGPASAVQRCDPGLVDFAQLRVYYTSKVVTKRATYPGETLWIAHRPFSRGSSNERWHPLPRVTWPEPGAMPFGAPLWLLGALVGTESATTVGEEEVHGAATTRIRAIVDCDKARRSSPWPIGFPRAPADTFPAVVWLDDSLRIMRMGCDWQPTTNGRPTLCKAAGLDHHRVLGLRRRCLRSGCPQQSLIHADPCR
jgi:hypothetical protein